MLPSWLSLTPAKIAEDSRLQPHQVASTFDTATLQTSIGTLLETQANLVEMQLASAATPTRWPFALEHYALAFPNETGSERSGRATRQLTVAEGAIKELVIAALFRTLPDENAIKISQAAADGRGEAIIGGSRIGSADSILKTLEVEIRYISGKVQGATATTRKRKRGVIRTGNGTY